MKTFVPESAPQSQHELILLPEALQNELETLAKNRNVSVEEFLKTETAEEYEDVIEEALHALPKELITKKMEEYRSKAFTLHQALINAKEALRLRSMMWKYDGAEKYEEETIQTIKIFDGAKYQQHLFEGKGNAAFVFQVPEVPNVCIKFLHTPSMQRYSPEREFEILGSVNQTAPSFKALKIPQAHGTAINMDATKSFFTMETINGLTLLQLVDFPGERERLLKTMGWSQEQLVERLSDQSLQETLAGDLDLIHHAGILHGDIHPRNIMIDVHGNFYLIDFGNALLTASLPEGMDYETIENRKDLDRSTFINSFKSTASLLTRQVKEVD